MAKAKIDIDFIKKLSFEPEKAIKPLDLVYVNNEELSISRVRKEEDFDYVLNGIPVSEKDQLERILSLVIPPAWENVKITHLPNGHLQATGRDAKNRKQYRYHPKWIQLRSQTKFYKMVSFGRVLPNIRKRVAQDLEQEGWPKSKVAALIVRLMEETHIRIGNEQYAKRNKTYGLTTLRTKHLHEYDENLRFEFIGKKGKEHKITLRNKKLIRLINRIEELPGWELFQFYDRSGDKQSVTSTIINDYLHAISGAIFSAKDFRTWSASILFFEHVKNMDAPKTEKQIRKNVLRAFDATAKALGNTRNVCRKSYVHPFIVESYEKQELKVAFDKIDKIKKGREGLSSSETVVLDLLKQYKPLKSL